MHAIAFGSKYTSPFLHATKSFATAVKKYRDAAGGGVPYLVRIDLTGLSGSQPVLNRGPGGSSGSSGPSGSQPAQDAPGPVVIDMSTDRLQKAGGQS